MNYLTNVHYGDPAVLLTLDHAGVKNFSAVLCRAEASGESDLRHDGVNHEFLIQPVSAEIDLTPTLVAWRLDQAKVTEILEFLESLRKPGAGHHYIDIASPAETLVISCDEYVNAAFPWLEPPS
ncbi:hypothetical protein ACTXG7_27525 [Mycolicibacterium sp. Dal123E01]|uniref:hypothetical protein n=1 Tax=Mycolicibacterium sp. Dal123E01 TaxID=3457578 RepID=UPI00403EE09C